MLYTKVASALSMRLELPASLQLQTIAVAVLSFSRGLLLEPAYTACRAAFAVAVLASFGDKEAGGSPADPAWRHPSSHEAASVLLSWCLPTLQGDKGAEAHGIVAPLAREPEVCDCQPAVGHHHSHHPHLLRACRHPALGPWPPPSVTLLLSLFLLPTLFLAGSGPNQCWNPHVHCLPKFSIQQSPVLIREEQAACSLLALVGSAALQQNHLTFKCNYERMCGSYLAVLQPIAQGGLGDVASNNESLR